MGTAGCLKEETKSRLVAKQYVGDMDMASLYCDTRNRLQEVRNTVSPTVNYHQLISYFPNVALF